MATTSWDVFLNESMDLCSDLDADRIRAGLNSGEFNGDDLVRHTGSSEAWVRLADHPEFAGGGSIETTTAASYGETPTLSSDFFDDFTPPKPEVDPQYKSEKEHLNEFWTELNAPAAPNFTSASAPRPTLSPPPPVQPVAKTATFTPAVPLPPPPVQTVSKTATFTPTVSLPPLAEVKPEPTVPTFIPSSPSGPPKPLPRIKAPSVQPVTVVPIPETKPEAPVEPEPEEDFAVFNWDEEDNSIGDEDADAASFTLSRGAADKVEELDLAAMVDVALQLVLFFLVTASSIVFKSMEIPSPNPDTEQSASATTTPPQDLDMLEDAILVEIDPQGVIKINNETVDANTAAIATKLRDVRQKTGLPTALITADLAARHKFMVMALDAAQEVGIGIQLGKPIPRP